MNIDQCYYKGLQLKTFALQNCIHTARHTMHKYREKRLQAALVISLARNLAYDANFF